MNKKIGSIILFVCCAAAFLISLRQSVYIGGYYADMYATSPTTVYGGNFWLGMDWLRIALLAVATLVSGGKLLNNLIEE